MSENTKPASVGRDALGVLLMAVAVLSGVAIVMAVTKPVGENQSSFTAVYTGVVGAIGPVAGLFLALGIFVIGVRLWMVGFSDRIGRDLFGVLVTTLTLSILVGTLAGASSGASSGQSAALRDLSWAGRFGEVTGGSVTRRLTVFVGIPFGLACVLLPAWLFWLRSFFAGRNKNAAPRSQTLGQTLAPRARVPADIARAPVPSFGPSFGRPDAHADFAAVTADESAALLLRPAPVEPLRKPSATSQSTSTSPSTSSSGSSLPPPLTDVRLHGGIPAGTQPLAPNTSAGTHAPAAFGAAGLTSKGLTSTHAQPRSAHPPRPASMPLEQRGELERPEKLAGTHLASAEGIVDREFGAPVRDVEAPGDENRGGENPSGEKTDGEEPDGRNGQASREPTRLESSLTSGTVAADSAGIGNALPILGAVDELEFDELERDDDAELNDDAGLNTASTAFDDEPTTETLAAESVRSDSSVTPLAQLPPPPSWEQPSLFDEPVDAYGTPQALVEALRKSNEQTAERLGGEDLDDKRRDEKSEHDDERAELEHEDDGDDGDDGDDEDDEDEQPEHALPSTESPPPLRARTESLFELELQPQLPPQPVAHESVSASRAHEPEPADTTDFERASEPAAEAIREPQVVRELDLDALAADDLVYRAGILFLERGRVAVSMLQREFGVDFKAATELLDQLQHAGLIGPYLGGQRRDILLTRDEWAQRIGVS